MKRIIKLYTILAVIFTLFLIRCYASQVSPQTKKASTFSERNLKLSTQHKLKKSGRVLITRFIYERTLVVPGRLVPLLADIQNPSAEPEEFTLQIMLPEKATLISGANRMHGILAPGKNLHFHWQLLFTTSGNYRIELQILTNIEKVRKATLKIPVQHTAWHQKRFLLSAFNPPFAWREPPYNDEILSHYKAAYFNHLLWVRDEKALMEKIHHFGFTYYLDIANLIGEEKLRGENGTPPPIQKKELEKLDHVVEKYKKDPLLTGYYICDEPSPSAFSNVAQVIKRIRTHDLTRPVFVNLYPYFSEKEGSPEYLETFLQTVQPDWLPFDRYIFFNGWDETTQYLAQLNLIRKYALKYDIPFVSFIQGVGTNGTSAADLDWRTPTEDEQRWMIYTALAYGAHGIVWFHWDDKWGVTGNPDGKKVYPAIQHLNQELQKLGPLMLPLTSTDAYCTGTYLVVFPGENRPKLLTSENELVVGVFKQGNGQENYFMLTNRNYNEAVKASAQIRLPLKNLERFDVTKGRWKKVRFKNRDGKAYFSILLDPGNGILFHFIPKHYME